MMKKQREERIRELERCFEEYADVPPEVTVKDDVLRLGVRFSSAALDAAKDARKKSYYIFSYNRVAFDEMEKGLSHNAPEEMRISGGQYNLRPTVISCRIAIDTPYLVDVLDEQLTLCCDDTYLADVEFLPEPAAYRKSFDDGVTYGETVAVIGWGERTLSTVYRHCTYFDGDVGCLFCDMNDNVRALRNLYIDEPYVIRKRPEQVAEVMYELFVKQPSDEPRRRSIQLTGGSIINHKNGQANDWSFYEPYVAAINDRVGGRWPLTLQTVAKEKNECQAIYDAGVNVHHANIEVWDKRLFGILCPGKEKYVSRDTWIQRVVDSVDVFGEGNVLPAMVTGIEMSQPHGFTTVDEAVQSTASGFDFLMRNGAIPRLAHWCIEPHTALADNAPPPLDYFIQIDRAWYRSWKRYRLPQPTGYSMGPGNAAFHVSGALDMGL